VPRKSKRQLAAERAWVTRRKNEHREFLRRSRAAKLGWEKRKAIKVKPPGRPPKQNVDFLVRIKFETRERRTGRMRQFSRDIVVPAPPGSSLRDLKRIARETLPATVPPLLKHMKADNVEIVEGPRTRRKRAIQR
jgi:hypothetical protein